MRYYFFINKVVESQYNKKQKIVLTSMTKAKYILWEDNAYRYYKIHLSECNYTVSRYKQLYDISQ